MKKREKLSGIELSTICRQLKIESTDRKKYTTDCANTQGLLRIIQSIPSPKAEPFKQWLAKVGYERMQEISNPEQSLERARENWQKLGRSEKWIHPVGYILSNTVNCDEVRLSNGVKQRMRG